MAHDLSRQRLNDDALVGRVINERFRLLAKVSRDATGRVYRAEQLPLGRPVTIKLLDLRRSRGVAEAEAQFQQRFLREASIAAQLQHPNTVAVFDYGRTHDGLFFMALEMVEGRTLQTVLAEEGALTVERTAYVALQIARSLRAAHRLGIIHGHLQPASVLLTRHGDEEDFVKVRDYGLAKPVERDDADELTEAGLFLGAPKYMSPERIRCDYCDARADVYSLGVCMYEMLTGRVPFDRPNAVQVLVAHMQEAVPPITRPDCPYALRELVMACLEKEPDRRPLSMDDVILALKGVLGRALHQTGAFTLTGEFVRVDTGPIALAHTEPGAQITTTPVRWPVDVSSVPAAPTLTQPALPAPTLPPKRTSLWAKASVVAACGVAAGLIALRSTRSERSAGVVEVKPALLFAASEAPKPQAVSTEPRLPEAKAPDNTARVRVRLSTDPAGAYVTVAGRRYGPTPADIELWGDHVAVGKEVTFVFERSGYDPVSITRVVHGDMLTLDVALWRYARVRTNRGEQAAAPSELADASERDDDASDERKAGSSEHTLQRGEAAQQGELHANETMNVGADVADSAAPPPSEPAPEVRAPEAPQQAVAEAGPTPAPQQPRIAAYSAPLRDTNAMPEYPRAALRQRVSGTVVSRVHVNPDGRVTKVEVLAGPEVFHDAVKKALMTWRYTPARLTDGTPVADTQIVRIPFQLK